MTIKDRLRKWLVPELDQIIEDHRLLNNNLSYLSGTVGRVVEARTEEQQPVLTPQLSKQELEDMLDNASASRNALFSQTAIGPTEIAQKNSQLSTLDKMIDQMQRDLKLCRQ